VHHVVAEFLLSERQTNFAFIPQGTSYIDAPNVNDPQENHARDCAFSTADGRHFLEIRALSLLS
jgi:hypothetical protein